MLIRAGIGNIALVGRPFKLAPLRGPIGRKLIFGFPPSATASIFVRAKCDKKHTTIPTLSEIRESLYTVPNALTFTRLVAAPVVGYLVVSGHTTWALGLFAYSCVTDFVDGFIARRYNWRSKVGSIIDPMADKALMVICTACLSHIGAVPLYLAALILGRDIMLLLAGIVIRYISLPAPRTFRRYWDFSLITVEVRPTTISKINTALQMAYLGGLMLSPLIDLGAGRLEYLVAATTVLSGLSYIFSKTAVRRIAKN